MVDIARAPWQVGNIPGPFQADLLLPETAAEMIKSAERPLFIVGSLALEYNLKGKKLIDYAIDIAEALKMPVVAVAHTVSGFLERSFKPDAFMPIINLIDRLRDPEWRGIKGEGQHDFVVFLGVLYYIGSQGLSTLKHFAPYLKTVTLCRFFHPNAYLSFPNMDDDMWKLYLEKLIEELKKR